VRTRSLRDVGEIRNSMDYQVGDVVVAAADHGGWSRNAVTRGTQGVVVATSGWSSGVDVRWSDPVTGHTFVQRADPFELL
jgi:hypothetical protein